MIGVAVNNRLAIGALRALQDRVPLVAARALNKSGTSGIVVLARAVSKDLGIKQATIKEKLETRPATATRPVFRIEVSGKRISLYDFQANGRYPSRGKGAGVTAKLPGGAGRYPHAFIARVKGNFSVFERKTAKRFPIRKLRGPSLPRVVGKFSGEFFARATETLKANLQRELNYETRLIAQASKAS